MPRHLVFLDSSTFEKDGSASLITLIEGFGQEGYPLVPNSTLTPVAGKALFGVALDRYETSYCTSPDCASIQQYGEDYTTPADDGTVSLIGKQGGLLTRVDRAT